MHENNGQAAPFALHHDAWGRLVLTEPGGRQHVGVTPVRAFPVSAPHQGIALCNTGGSELFWIEDLDELPAPLRQQLQEELGRRTFLPVLRQVLRISAPMEPSEWEVETDRGRTRFRLEGEDDVHRLEGHRALVTDANGIRYLIPDLRALDATSRRLLERYLWPPGASPLTRTTAPAPPSAAKKS
jgi:hypothetical protein